MFLEEIIGGRSFGILTVVTQTCNSVGFFGLTGSVLSLEASISVTFLWQIQITSEKNSFLRGRKAAGMGTATFLSAHCLSIFLVHVPLATVFKTSVCLVAVVTCCHRAPVTPVVTCCHLGKVTCVSLRAL